MSSKAGKFGVRGRETHSDKEGRKERRGNSQLCVEDGSLKEEG